MLALLLALVCGLPVGARADEAPGLGLAKIPLSELDAVPAPSGRGHGGAHEHAEKAEKAEPALPPEATSHHNVALPDRTLSFTAKIGASTFEDAQGNAVADMGYLAYLLDGSEPRKRPVTFVINGGPGSASAWLQLGAVGPWRLPVTEATAHPTAPADLAPNPDTWLDFTDLVFIDPVGTGFSRLHNTKDKALRERFWSVQGDINSITVLIKRWLEANGRVNSPKFILGESYGGFRAPRLAQTLQRMPGLALNGIVMVSPAFAALNADFPGLGSALTRTCTFPSLAAAIADTKGPVTPQQLAAFEQEAITGYLPDMLAGPRDTAAVERLAGRIAAVTGLDIDTVRRLGPRASPQTFLEAIDRSKGLTSNTYDVTQKRIAAYDGPDLIDRGDDLGGMSMQLQRAMTGLVQGPLGWHPQREYRVLARDVGWKWSGAESVTALRSALVRDPTFRALIAHGYADLVTPYFRTKLIVAQLPTIGADNSRLQLKVYGGGHMLYSRAASRAQLRKDAVEMYQKIAAER
jgi:carboxypeptidase C (cathepsin A)